MDKHADSDLEKTVGEGDAGLGWLRPQESKSASALGESWTVTLLLRHGISARTARAEHVCRQAVAEQNGGRVRQRPREETDTHGTLLPAPCPSLPRSVPNPWASIPARPAAANSLSGLTLAMSQWENSEGARPVVINHQAAALAPTPSPWLEIGSRQTDQTDRGQGSLRDRRASRQPRLCMMDLQTVRISPSPHSLRAFTGVSRRWEATASTDGVPPSRLHDTPLRHAARHVLAAGTRRSGLDFLRQRFTSVTCKRHLPQVDSSQVIARRQEREEGGPSPGFSDIK
ncbi:hypothetical protein PCL_08556 [Purpureocillium lilacinum]|uniref:Uncharacterized protein n=1 Tax=Purpureocillium lilacinum TaxID=33203 RepID=A0A2U3DR81_PURLI|nr:hypothetical protein PCL_08556 [Purpureocillium lilacinum]